MGPIFFVFVFGAVLAAPLNRPHDDLDAIIDQFIEKLYQYQATGDNDEQMQSDQPPENKIDSADNMTDYLRTSRNRAKDNWIQVLKENILRQIGRSNMTVINDDSRTNVSMIPDVFNRTTLDDDHITEKIRSYYPSCEVPTNMEQDVWKDENIMNLYFNNFDNSDEKGLNIATATLRLYRIPTENVTKTTQKSPDCDTSSTTEDEKLLRVSIYWYTRSVRKKKVKRRLSDSKVIQESARWVELSVKPAARAWSRGRNLGLAILVEDQEGTILKADRLFKGALCMVGASTPKPIPSIIIDAARQSNELDRRIHSLLGGNSTSSVSGDIPMLPTIDVCTLEFPENYSQPPQIGQLRINACNLKKSHEHARMLAERDRLERLATLPELLAPRHIRHQRQHLKFDPRSNIVNKRILTNEELQALNITIDR
ncbi:uncharacterized protein LOC660239 isoform X2 [Tribolium castaneum]|uniref:TGF-beta propeptide domain-containing protein n=1 Tax=Tribolium castaneum TaxID=7070 RepID=D2A4P6_TRICA|nr:PREDICTED: uncharacterized protein LOC660239 isoform X2 [Tribolium castaneum]EFA05196.1 hypothetical protein TcasGA2_TC015330 [Tribolium castaneum]|eukprot:XP_971581.1 PREDICTED: uncharacterized protein LOC660239 isoform X2 [Tribolium castaneum]